MVTLRIKLPLTVYERLRQIAGTRGASVETLARIWLQEKSEAEVVPTTMRQRMNAALRAPSLLAELSHAEQRSDAKAQHEAEPGLEMLRKRMHDVLSTTSLQAELTHLEQRLATEKTLTLAEAKAILELLSGQFLSEIFPESGEPKGQ